MQNYSLIQRAPHKCGYLLRLLAPLDENAGIFIRASCHQRGLASALIKYTTRQFNLPAQNPSELVLPSFPSGRGTPLLNNAHCVNI